MAKTDEERYNEMRQLDKEFQLCIKKEWRKEKIMQINKKINGGGWLTEEVKFDDQKIN